MPWSTLLPDHSRSCRKLFESPIRFIANRLRQQYQRLVLSEQIRTERRALSGLTDAQLRDIGIHRADADEEVKRKFWDLPADRV